MRQGRDAQEEPLPITGLPAGADDPALLQALQAQLAPHAYLDGWRCRYAPVAGADAPASVNTVAVAPSAAQEETDGASRETSQTRVGAISAAAADGAVQTAEAKQAARPKPVPPPRSGEQRQAARLEALRMTAQRKGLRARLQAGEENLEQALARGDEVAMRMRTETLLRALPGIGGATAARLMREAGIDPGRRAGALTAGQREHLLAVVGTVRQQPPGRRR